MLWPMSETSETSENAVLETAETSTLPPPPESPAATSTKSNRGKIAAIGGGAAALGLVIGLGVGWLGFGDDHSSNGRGGQPAIAAQMD